VIEPCGGVSRAGQFLVIAFLFHASAVHALASAHTLVDYVTPRDMINVAISGEANAETLGTHGTSIGTARASANLNSGRLTAFAQENASLEPIPGSGFRVSADSLINENLLFFGPTPGTVMLSMVVDGSFGGITQGGSNFFMDSALVLGGNSAEFEV
jgi:hypothetical protein